MPVYQLVHSGIPLSLTDRDRLAQGILAIHHSETNAPEPFVRIAFSPAPLGTIYTAGRIAPSLLLSCGVRAGRTLETKQRIIQRCYALLVEVTHTAPDQILVVVEEQPSSQIMEAGMIMPEPNDEAEAAWLAELQKTYPGRYDDWTVHGQAPTGQNGLAELRDLAAHLVTQAERQGANAVALLEHLAGDRA
jgi:phenylpyruvate tautomerase PptA (4-oxalocrotonate tautomerase family)